MLVLSNSFINKPIASIQSSHKIGKITDIIVDPRSLKVFAFYVESPNLGRNLVLHAEDIRSINYQGVVIDNNDQLMAPSDDLVRLKEVLEINYRLTGKPVFTESGSKLGKVNEYVVDTLNFEITKIHVERPLVRSLGDSQLIIDRQQIVKLTDQRVIVKNNVKKAKSFSLKEVFIGKNVALTPDQSKSSSKLS